MLLTAFPSDPEISGEVDLMAGVQRNLTCAAQNLYPEDLSVEWKLGNITVMDDSAQITEESGGKSSISSKYSFIPTARDNGTNITCRVIQRIPAGFENSRSHSVQLTVNLGK